MFIIIPVVSKPCACQTRWYFFVNNSMQRLLILKIHVLVPVGLKVQILTFPRWAHISSIFEVIWGGVLFYHCDLDIYVCVCCMCMCSVCTLGLVCLFMWAQACASMCMRVQLCLHVWANVSSIFVVAGGNYSILSTLFGYSLFVREYSFLYQYIINLLNCPNCFYSVHVIKKSMALYHQPMLEILHALRDSWLVRILIPTQHLLYHCHMMWIWDSHELYLVF